jgi:AraC-like DNA-binding protein
MAKLKSGFFGERAIIIPTPIIEDLKNDTLGSLLHITDIGYYPKAYFHFRKRSEEEAKQYILIYCVEGFGWFEIDGTRQKVSADHFFILPKGKAHSYGSNSNSPWTIYWIHFDGEKADYFSLGFNKPTPVIPEKDSRIKERLYLFEEIYSTLKNGYSKSNIEYSISSLFHFLGSLKFLSAYRESLSLKQSERNFIDDAVHFMHENIHKKLTLKDLANYSKLSTSHFSALFQLKTGFSPLNYFSQLKIQQSCHYIDFTDMKINKICIMMGFDDPLYFSRVFTKIMGISPTEYRKKKKG